MSAMLIIAASVGLVLGFVLGLALCWADGRRLRNRNRELRAALAGQDPLVRGVTLSGGEPFAQAEGCAALARLLKARGYELATYTGYTFEELLAGTPAQKRLLEQIDILVDGRFVQAERSLELRFRGSRNQRILDVPKSLAAGAAVWTADPRWVGEG